MARSPVAVYGQERRRPGLLAVQVADVAARVVTTVALSGFCKCLHYCCPVLEATDDLCRAAVEQYVTELKVNQT